MVGLYNHRNGEDEALLATINEYSGTHTHGAGGGKKTFVIVDARPKINAQANQAGGKGARAKRASLLEDEHTRDESARNGYRHNGYIHY